MEPAFVAFGAAQSAYYESSLAERRCVFCGAANAERVAALEWATTITRASHVAKSVALHAITAALGSLVFGAAHGVGGAHGEDITFATRHCTCTRCFANWRAHGRTLRIVSTLAIAVGVIGLVFGVLFLLLGFFGDPIKPSDRRAFLLYGSIGFTAGVIGVIMAPLTRRWSVPPALRHLPESRIRPGKATLLKKT